MKRSKSTCGKSENAGDQQSLSIKLRHLEGMEGLVAGLRQRKDNERRNLRRNIDPGEPVKSPEMQINELREYCERRGWKLAGECVDSGISGAGDSRPELNRLTATHKRRFDVVAVWKFDRFVRSVSHLNQAARFKIFQ
jgi:Resolvase, N terminal domain